jgi:hypothetical protein
MLKTVLRVRGYGGNKAMPSVGPALPRGHADGQDDRAINGLVDQKPDPYPFHNCFLSTPIFSI